MSSELISLSDSSRASSSAPSTSTMNPALSPSHTTLSDSSDGHGLFIREGSNNGGASDRGSSDLFVPGGSNNGSASDDRTYRDAYDNGFNAGFRSGRTDRKDDLDELDRSFVTSFNSVKQDMDLLREELVMANRTILALRQEQEEATTLIKKLEDQNEVAKRKFECLFEDQENTTTTVDELIADHDESMMTVRALRDDHDDVAKMVNSSHEVEIEDAKEQIKKLRNDVTVANDRVQYLEAHFWEGTQQYTPFSTFKDLPDHLSDAIDFSRPFGPETRVMINAIRHEVARNNDREAADIVQAARAQSVRAAKRAREESTPAPLHRRPAIHAAFSNTATPSFNHSGSHGSHCSNISHGSHCNKTGSQDAVTVHPSTERLNHPIPMATASPLRASFNSSGSGYSITPNAKPTAFSNHTFGTYRPSLTPQGQKLKYQLSAGTIPSMPSEPTTLPVSRVNDFSDKSQREATATLDAGMNTARSPVKTQPDGPSGNFRDVQTLPGKDVSWHILGKQQTEAGDATNAQEGAATTLDARINFARSLMKKLPEGLPSNYMPTRQEIIDSYRGTGQDPPWYTLEKLFPPGDATNAQDEAAATSDAHNQTRIFRLDSEKPTDRCDPTNPEPDSYYFREPRLPLPITPMPCVLEPDHVEPEPEEERRQAKRQKMNYMDESDEYGLAYW
ncbi:hypothetical protein GGR57DRAFT_505481 [Xylariaceae sp. FL1272]|nr:hypothetical protein GGR57DRAFT_505481 [Xylariaceae sp. FL1272]